MGSIPIGGAKPDFGQVFFVEKAGFLPGLFAISFKLLTF